MRQLDERLGETCELGSRLTDMSTFVPFTAHISKKMLKKSKIINMLSAICYTCRHIVLTGPGEGEEHEVWKECGQSHRAVFAVPAVVTHNVGALSLVFYGQSNRGAKRIA